MQDYVLCYCEDTTNDKILIIHKDRPEWQNGRINLPGGKIEEGETPIKAAIRELYEETGYEVDPVFACEVGWIDTGQGIVHIVQFFEMSCWEKVVPREGETERSEWVQWSDIMYDKRLFPNLRVAIPLLMAGVDSFVITDTEDSRGETAHKMTIVVPTFESRNDDHDS